MSKKSVDLQEAKLPQIAFHESELLKYTFVKKKIRQRIQYYILKLILITLKIKIMADDHNNISYISNLI
jgi:pyruvate-formate lyase